MAEQTEIQRHEGLDEALFHAQMEYPPLEKGTKVRVKTKTGGEYTYNYATLAYTISVTEPYLRKHGLFVKERTEYRDGVNLQISTLVHMDSKETEVSELDVSTSGDMKDLGGNITYARRYNYWNLTGRIGEDDSEPRDLPRGGSRQPQQGGKVGPGAPSGQSADDVPSGPVEPSGDSPGELKTAIYTVEQAVIKLRSCTRPDMRQEIIKMNNLPDDIDVLKTYLKALNAIVSPVN